MKKITIKSLLITAALCLGTSAWAEEVTATLVHTASTSCGKVVAEVTGTVDVEKEHYNNEGSGTWQGYAFAEFEFDIPENQVVVSAQLTWTGTTTAKARNHALYYLNVGNELNYDAISNSPSLLRYNENKKWIVTESFANEATKVADVTSAINDVYNNNSNKIIFQWTGNQGGGDLYGKKSDKAPKLVITTADATTTTSYTIKYWDESDNLLNSVTIEDATIGSHVTASNEELASFFNGDKTKKYIYTSGNEEITLVKDAANNVINLVFREAKTYSYTVKSNIGDFVNTGQGFEGDVAYVAYPRLINVEGTLYTSNTAGNKECLYTFNMDADKKVEIINFTKTDITGVVFFSEAENIKGLTADNGGQAGSRNSMKQGAYATEDTEITTLQSGKYKISGARSGNTGVTFAFVVNGATVSQTTTSGSWGTFDGEEFNLVEKATIVLKAAGQGGNSSKTLDYIYIQKTGEATTITAAGYATFSSTYAVDFSAEKDLKAYTATVNGNKVVMTPIENGIVPANTGVILKGAADNYTGVITTTEAVIENNDLVAATEEIAELATTDGTYNNYILNVVEGKVGFYQANNKKVAAGKAYLQVPVTNGAKALTIVWNDGETTGIEENYEFGTMNSDAATFDLSGRKVANPAKGLYIKNGKKYIVK